MRDEKMSAQGASTATPSGALPKAPTGIAGLDAITGGGLPAGRPTLVCGGPGCGKTVLAMEFLVRGAREFGEPGVFLSFEEAAAELRANFRPFGFDLDALATSGRLRISQVDRHSDEIVEAGRFSLDGLLIRLQQAIEQVQAKRVVLDTLESLFSSIPDASSLRGEIARLFRWLRAQGVTTIVTGERGGSSLTRHGFEEYVSDCVLQLDHRVSGNISKRRLRIIKYRGSPHGADEYPFLIGERGISVFPITEVRFADEASTERVSTGIADLDEMLDGKGYYRGSSVLVSGTPGAGKSTVACAFASATCRRGEKCLYFAMEEPESQLLRNMRSVALELGPHVDAGNLKVVSVRPTAFGLEEHLVTMLSTIDAFGPDVVVVDPITNFVSIGSTEEVKSMLTRVFDHLKAKGVTSLLTSLTPGPGDAENTDTNISSLMDTWILIRHRFDGQHRGRWLHVVKSRGMAHSQNARELIMSATGVSLRALPDGARSRSSAGVPESNA